MKNEIRSILLQIQNCNCVFFLFIFSEFLWALVNHVSGGVALVYVSQPLDTVKVKMQTFPTLYKGMSNCLMQTLRKDGFVRGWYAGTLPAIAANVAENSILFAGEHFLHIFFRRLYSSFSMLIHIDVSILGYGACQKLIVHIEGHKSVDELSSLSNAFAGVIASFFSSFTLCPTELIKCKLQSLREMKNSSHITPFRLTRQILKQEGIRGLYRGLVPTLAREMPGYFFFFGGYEGTRELLRQ